MNISLPVLAGACTIALTRGKSALIDRADYAEVSRWKWYASEASPGRFYAARRDGRRIVRLHRILMGDPPGVQVDHRNGDGLDDRRRNLRPATRAGNNANAGKRHGTSSSYKGVSRYRDQWQAGIRKDGRRIHLGVHDREEEAAVAYDHAARILFREYARTNRFGPGQAPPPARRREIGADVERRLARAGRAA